MLIMYTPGTVVDGGRTVGRQAMTGLWQVGGLARRLADSSFLDPE